MILNFKNKTMNLTQDQETKFGEWQTAVAALTVADLEASTWPLIKQWGNDWMDYMKSGTAPGVDRPPNKPPHP